MLNAGSSYLDEALSVIQYQRRTPVGLEEESRGIQRVGRTYSAVAICPWLPSHCGLTGG